MTAFQLDSVISGALATLEDWNQFLNGFLAITGPDGSKFELTANIPALTPPITIEELSQKLSGVIALINEFSDIETTILIPDANATELSARVGGVRATVEKLRNFVSGFDENSKVNSLDPASLVASNEAGQQINMGPTLVELYPLVQALLTAAYQLRNVAGVSGKGGLALELAQIHSARSAQRAAITDFNRLTRAAESERRNLQAQIAASKDAQSRIASLEAEAKKNVEHTEGARQRAEELNSSINATSEIAAKLKDAIDEYSKSFAGFQRDLDARNTDFEKGKSRLEAFFAESERRRDDFLSEQTNSHRAITEQIEVNEQEVARLVARSRSMLGEATVSGLSASFAKEMREAGDQLWWMQILFFVSVGLLIFGAGIVLDAFPWLDKFAQITKLDAPSNGDPLSVAVYLLANFLRTLTFLLAPLILLIYAARRYTELFRMKAHYTYKFTVAASLPGFKLEAPSYAEAITASAFKELLFNPGDSVGKPEGEAADKAGNTFLQRLIEPFVIKAMNKMGEIPKQE